MAAVENNGFAFAYVPFNFKIHELYSLSLKYKTEDWDKAAMGE